MKRPTLPIFGLLLTLSLSAGGQTKAPAFRDYPVRTVYNGKNVAPKLDQGSYMFRTRLRYAARQKRDFAGEQVLASWGCGASCRVVAAVNVRSGRVTFAPFTICCWSYDPDVKPVNYRLNSRMIVFTGSRNESEADGPDDKHYFEFRNDRFRFIKTTKGAKKQN